MSAPRFSPAVLEALARVAMARAHDRTTEPRSLARIHAMEDTRQATFRLYAALDADAVAAHPVPVGDEDEASRDASPFRFKTREIL